MGSLLRRRSADSRREPSAFNSPLTALYHAASPVGDQKKKKMLTRFQGGAAVTKHDPLAFPGQPTASSSAVAPL